MSPDLAFGAADAVPHVRGMQDLQTAMPAILRTAHRIKAKAAAGPLPPLLAGRSVLILMESPSTRTRISFEVGVARLGGTPVVVDAGSTQLGRGESIEDTAQVLSRYADAIVLRTGAHATLTEAASYATVPVINALTDREHPCQVLADWMTLQEAWGGLKGRELAYVGDGNNMCQSYLLAAPLAGMDIRVSTPPGYAPDWDVMEQAQGLAHLAGTDIHLVDDPAAAVRGADAVATDTWTSMGREAEADERRRAFAGFTVTETLLREGAPGCRFLHCLPGHWGEEATHGVAHGPRSMIYDQAENRMWVQMALLAHVLGCDLGVLGR